MERTSRPTSSNKMELEQTGTRMSRPTSSNKWKRSRWRQGRAGQPAARKGRIKRTEKGYDGETEDGYLYYFDNGFFTAGYWLIGIPVGVDTPARTDYPTRNLPWPFHKTRPQDDNFCTKTSASGRSIVNLRLLRRSFGRTRFGCYV